MLKYDKHLSAIINRYRADGFKVIDWTPKQGQDGIWYYFGQLERIRNIPYDFKTDEAEGSAEGS